MIYRILTYLRNFFVYKQSTSDEIVADGVLVADPDEFLPGQYIRILNSRLNDGVYLITGIMDDLLEVQGGLTAEQTDFMYIDALVIPPQLLELIADIETYVANGDSGGVKSESLGDYSVAYTGDGSWQSVFKERLSPWRRLFQ